jgi:hypothetical protein
MKSLALLITLAFFKISISTAATPVIYLKKQSMIKSIAGSKTEKIAKLGGDDFRFYYKETLSGDKLKVVDAIAEVVTSVYPYAVIVGDEIYNKDDDNCTKMPDRIRGVDIGQACRNHDYCYYQIADFKRVGNSFKKSFSYCHDAFIKEIKEACHETKPLLGCGGIGKVYEWGVRYIPYSYINYIRNQDKTAHMFSMILEKYYSDHSFKNLLDSKASPFKASQLLKKVKEYCNASQLDTFKKTGIPIYESVQHQPHRRDFLTYEPLKGCESLPALLLEASVR